MSQNGKLDYRSRELLSFCLIPKRKRGLEKKCFKKKTQEKSTAESNAGKNMSETVNGVKGGDSGGYGIHTVRLSPV